MKTTKNQKIKTLILTTSPTNPATHVQNWYEYEGYGGPEYARDCHNGDSDGCIEAERTNA